LVPRTYKTPVMKYKITSKALHFISNKTQTLTGNIKNFKLLLESLKKAINLP
jgi:hypothetical protein